MGRQLAEAGRFVYGEQKRLAEQLGVTTRTLRNWRRAALYPPERTAGRPAHPMSKWWDVARAVRAKIAELGMVGWRTLYDALGGRWTKYVVQHVLALIKLQKRRKIARRRRRDARHIEVLGAGTLWSLDETHIGRTLDERAVEGHVLKDNGSRDALRTDVGRPATGEDAVDLLEHARQDEGALPLALITDNGAPYKSVTLGEYLERHQVLHIRNLPHTPQHNGACEQLNGELKADSGLGKGVLIECLSDAAATLEASRCRVNRRPRAVLGGQSADEQHRRTRKEYTAAERKATYEDGCRAMEHAMQGTGNVRARRLAARRAAFAVLEQYGIIKQTRGSGE
jgi:transposase InsO family protein